MPLPGAAGRCRTVSGCGGKKTGLCAEGAAGRPPGAAGKRPPQRPGPVEQARGAVATAPPPRRGAGASTVPAGADLTLLLAAVCADVTIMMRINDRRR